jgi:hypothetical protein
VTRHLALLVRRRDIIGARLVASSSEERREWEHGMNLYSQPLGMPGESDVLCSAVERIAKQETRHVHASQIRRAATKWRLQICPCGVCSAESCKVMT